MALIVGSWFKENTCKILLMVQKSGVRQLGLVVYPIIYHGFFLIPGCTGFSSNIP